MKKQKINNEIVCMHKKLKKKKTKQTDTRRHIQAGKKTMKNEQKWKKSCMCVHIQAVVFCSHSLYSIDMVSSIYFFLEMVVHPIRLLLLLMVRFMVLLLLLLLMSAYTYILERFLALYRKVVDERARAHTINVLTHNNGHEFMYTHSSTHKHTIFSLFDLLFSQ